MRKHLPPSGGSSGRTFDMNVIAAGSNGSQVISTKRACRLTVTIIGARNLRRGDPGLSVKDPIFKIKVEDESQKSREIKTGIVEHGVLRVNQSFTFDVNDVKNAVLSVYVYVKGVLGLEESLGRCKNMAVADLLEEKKSCSDLEAQWYELYSKDGSRVYPGKVLMYIVAGIAKPEQKIHAYVGTWNVGNSRPAQDLSSWLPNSTTYEIVAVGAQECDYQPRQPFTECGKDWMATLKSRLGSRYKVIRGITRGQMRLAVFVRDDAENAISEVDSGSEATGVGHVMANKGGVCIAFKFWDTGLCFVNCHLAAHVGQCEARNSNFREIAGQLRVGMQSMDIMNQFHHVFWLGDLNYRLDLGDVEDQPSMPRTSWQKIVKQIHDGDYKKLLPLDELQKEQAAGRVLHGFKEGEINFPPTFKMQQDTFDTYDPKRIPAWCDRVLWRSLPGCDTQLLSYFSSPNIITSDHKPVAAIFAFLVYALPSSSPSSLDDDDKRWHVRFTSLRAKNLRASDISGYSDPYVSFVGPNLFQEVHSKVKFQTLHPVWNPLKDLPTLVLNTFPLQRLEKEYLMVRVLDYDYASSDDTLGYTVIPLAPAVTAFQKGGTADFNVALSHHGLPAGTLEGAMKLTWEKNVTKRRFRITNDLMGRTLSLRDSLRKRVLSKRMF